MPLLLVGDHATCALLRDQYASSSIRKVELTGVGLFVDFEVPATVPRIVPPNITGGDVNIEVEGMKYGAGCVLFVKAGAISTLEGYAHGGEQWPEHPVVGALRDAVPIIQ